MARSTEPMVQITDLPIPAFATTTERIAYLSARKVTEVLDWMNRPCVKQSDAFRLRDLADREAAESSAARARALAVADSARAKAQARRQKVFSDAFLAAGDRVRPEQREAAAHAALVEAEASMDPVLRSQLSPAQWPISRMDAMNRLVSLHNAAQHDGARTGA